jgi:hypothetical protein
MLIEGYSCVFEPGERNANENRAIIMALYPPPGSDPHKQHNNRTSREIAKVTANTHYDWNDLYPTAPYKNTTCDEVDLDALHKEIVHRSPEAQKLVLEWGKRLGMLVTRERSYGNNAPAVIWCGNTVNLAHHWLVDMTSAKLAATIAFKTPWFTVTQNQLYVSIEGAVHPSAHLQSRGEKTARKLFNITFGCFEEIRKRPYATSNALIAASGESVEEARTAMILAFNVLGIPHEEGWLDREMRHLRSVDWTDKALVETLRQFKKLPL